MVGNVTIARRLVASTNDVFRSMLFMDLHPLASKEGKDIRCESDITSMVGLAGDMKGILAVHCPTPVATSLAGAMLGMELAELDEDVKDAIGEITNMITGGMKTFFDGDGAKLDLSIPTTLIGRSFRVGGLFGAQRILVPFDVEAGTFWVEFKFLAA